MTVMPSTSSQAPPQASGPRWRDLGAHYWVRISILAALFVFLFRHEMGRMLNCWINDASWSHGFLIPLFSLYFLNRHKARILGQAYRPNAVGVVLLFLCLGVYYFNLVSPSGYAYMRSLSVIWVLGSMVLFLGGWPLVRATWLPVAYLVFAVPLPNRYYVSLTLPMRELAAVVAASLLNWVDGVEATVRGAVIDVVYHGRVLEPSLNVAEACSGMRLLMAFLALGVAMAYLHDRPWVRRLILLLSTIPIAIFCNTIRVAITGFLYVFVHPRYTQGLYHDLLGVAMLPLALGMYGFLSWFMSSLFVDDEEQPKSVIIRRGEAPAPRQGLAASRQRTQDAGSIERRPMDGGRLGSRSAFLTCAGVLLVSGIGMSVIVQVFGVYLKKEPMVLQKPLADMNEAALAPFRVVSRLWIRDPDVLKSLGTGDYVQWVLEDTSVDASDPGREVFLFITFYGLPDRVPHVPEECYVGGGFQRLTTEVLALTIPTALGPREIDVRYLVFGNPAAATWSSGEKVPVLYLFRVNADYGATREDVRVALNKNLFGRGSYFSKVELVFNRMPGSLGEDQVRRIGRKLLAVLLPVLERDHWPREEMNR